MSYSDLRFMKNKFSLSNLRWISRTDYREPRLSRGSRLPRVFAAASIVFTERTTVAVSLGAHLHGLPNSTGYSLRTFAT